MKKIKNVTITVKEYCNCYTHAVEISAFTEKERKLCRKNSQYYMAVATNPQIADKDYSLAIIDDEEFENDDEYEFVKDEMIQSFIEEYAYENSIDLDTATVKQS